MPTFKFAKFTSGILAAAFLVACDPASLGMPAASRTTLNVAGQPINVTAPSGFCIDEQSTSIDENGAFVLMSHCALMGAGGPIDEDAIGAALTTSISTGGLGGEGSDTLQSLEDLEEFIGTSQGRALLSRSGQSGAVHIISTTRNNDVLYVLVDDGGRQPISGLERRFWRGFLELEDHLTVISLFGFEGAGVGDQGGLDLLASLATGLQRANR